MKKCTNLLIVSILFVVAGCGKQETVKSHSPETQEPSAETAQAPGTEVAQAPGAEIAQAPGTEAAQAPGTEAAQAPADNRQSNDAATVTCGKHTLNPADAQKWDCVPRQGFLCTDPQGCPVNGNTVSVGLSLNYVTSIQEAKGYVLVGELYSYVDEDGFSEFRQNLGWKCTLDEGCLCGAAAIAKEGVCYEGSYDAKDALTGNCNKDNCSAFCKNDKCVCGDVTPLRGEYEKIRCHLNQSICMRSEGCTAGDKSYKYNEIWEDYELNYDNCVKENGCSCGNAVCKITDDCFSNENKCIVNNDTDERDTANLPKGYKLNYDNKLQCDDDNGCECGSQLCPSYYICENDLCVEKSGFDDGTHTETFYCDDECRCAPDADCPKGALCVRYHGNPDYNGDDRYLCDKIEFKDKTELFGFLKHIQRGGHETKNVIIDYSYDGWGKKGYFINVHDGKKYKNLSVACSTTGCDCAGTPLAEDYLCTRHTVILDRVDPDKDPWNYSEYAAVCPKYYLFDSYDDSCVIADEVVEQMCFNSKGCACGTGRIAMGDVCREGQAHCSSTNARQNCVCGDVQLQDTNYGCYLDKLVCQAETCSCRGKDIHLGDVCEKDKIICGANSRTTGCMCGEKPLRDGYRCFRKEQRCDCNEADNKKCTCACGDKQIMKNNICLDDDTPFELVLPKEFSYCNTNVGGSFKDGHPLTNDLEDIIYDCTCGTGMSNPGEGYECIDEPYQIGVGSEWQMVPAHVGWQCRRLEGCACGKETCQPGDLCEKAKDGSKVCKPYLTFDGVCEHHKLAPSLIADGYECFRSNKNNYNGWYCSKAEGCACGDAKCEYLQSCLTPGICSKNKLLQSDVVKLRMPEIESTKEDY